MRDKLVWVMSVRDMSVRDVSVRDKSGYRQKCPNTSKLLSWLCRYLNLKNWTALA